MYHDFFTVSAVHYYKKWGWGEESNIPQAYH